MLKPKPTETGKTPAEQLARLSSRLAAEMKERRRLEDELRSLPTQILDAQELERRRIAAELHDGVNQILASIRFRLGHLEAKVNGEAAELADQMTLLLERAVNEVRRISKNLRPSELDDFGLVPAIEQLISEFETRTEIAVTFKKGPFPKRLRPRVELALYRILQEALSNVEQHAKAQRVRVSLSVDARFGTLTVIDDGIGFAAGKNIRSDKLGRGLGIIHMRERAQSLDGLFAIKSAPGKGTEVAAHLKLESGK